MTEVNNRPAEIMATIVCQSCHEEVKVELIAYGGSYVGICPLCSKLAYHEDGLPEGAEQKE